VLDPGTPTRLCRSLCDCSLARWFNVAMSPTNPASYAEGQRQRFLGSRERITAEIKPEKNPNEETAAATTTTTEATVKDDEAA
jgi:hypothetical protein